MINSVTVERVLNQKQVERTRQITTLMAKNGGGEKPLGFTYWALVYDFEQAPWTTNREQLEELGIETPVAATLSDEELKERLDDVIQGLSLLGVYLLNSNHFSDVGLYEHLRTSVLEEAVRDSICEEAANWVDLCDPSCGCENIRELWLRYYAEACDREEACAEGVVVPRHEDPVSDRDDSLPSPADGPTRISFSF